MRISDWSSDVCSSDLWGQCVGIDDNAVNFGGKMRRGGGDKAPGLGMDRDAGEAGDDLAVGFFLQPRLDRFPVGKAERARQCRGKDGFPDAGVRSEEHTSELQSLMRISYAVLCLKH